MRSGKRGTMLVVVILVGYASGARAADCYVATTGSDSNPGTSAQPWRTIQHAADAAAAGDTVTVRAGIYRESISVRTAGTASAPIVFQGERGSGGEWLTVVDPTVTVSGWTPAPEIGTGVFKTSSVGFNPHVMTLDDRMLARISDLNMSGLGDSDGFTLLATPANATATTTYNKVTVPFWDGVEVVYGTRAGITYIRFRNGDNPSQKALRVSPAGAVFDLQGVSHVVVRCFLIRGAEWGVLVEGAAAVGNIVEQNYVMHGRARVAVYQAQGTIIRDNQMTLGYYAWDDFGAWEQMRAPSAIEHRYGVRERLYSPVFKHWVNDGGRGDASVRDNGGDNQGTVVSGNHIFQDIQGIRSGGPSRDWDIHDNVIHNMCSIGYIVEAGATGHVFHDNLVYDGNINVRFMEMRTSGDTDRLVYLYRDRLYNPPGVGVAMYFHFLTETPPANAGVVHVWFYQMSFAGGQAVIQISDWADTNGGLPGVNMLNSIISSERAFEDWAGITGNASMWGLFAYNWLGGNVTSPAWAGSATNLYAPGEQMWDPASLPDFSLPAGSAARAAGIDLSQPYVIAGTTYPPLPGMEPGYFSGSAPDLGAVQSCLTGATRPCGRGACAGIQHCADGAWSTCDGPPPGPEVCDNGIDDDCDGLTDAADPDCAVLPPPLSLVAARATGPVTVDGELTEFAGAASITFGGTAERGADANTAVVRALWDDENLYIAYEVSDTKLNAIATAPGGEAWADDNLEVYLDRRNDHGAWRDGDDFHFFVNLQNVRDDFGEGFGTEFTSAVMLDGTLGDNGDVDRGYRIEVAIPWAAIGGAPTEGERIGVDFCAADRDTATDGYQYYDWAGLTEFTQPAQWGDLILGGSLAGDGGIAGDGDGGTADGGGPPGTHGATSGCGCRTIGLAAPSTWPGILLLLIAARRRRSGRSAGPSNRRSANGAAS